MKTNYVLIVAAITLLSAIKPITSIAQNLVPNPGFEVQDTCPAVSELFLASPWDSPTLGTPDLFNSDCSTQNSPARTGVGSSGVYCYSTFPDNREYMQVALISPLVSGQTYCVSFYTKRSNFRYATNQLGAYFSNGAINLTTTSVLSYSPQVENPVSNTLSSSSSWVEISGSFVAAGNEDHMLIGNFYDDASTDTVVANSGSSSNVSYYKIDDISVEACSANSVDEVTLTNNSISCYPSPTANVLNLNISSEMIISNAHIIDMSGRIMKIIPLSIETTGIYTMDVSFLSEGIYTISFQTTAGSVNKRIIIVK